MCERSKTYQNPNFGQKGGLFGKFTFKSQTTNPKTEKPSSSSFGNKQKSEKHRSNHFKHQTMESNPKSSMLSNSLKSRSNQTQDLGFRDPRTTPKTEHSQTLN